MPTLGASKIIRGVDLRWRPLRLPTAQNIYKSIQVFFLRNLAKLYAGAPWRVGAPPPTGIF